MTETRPLRVAIVGSGPSGMYAAGHLLEAPSGTFAAGRLSRRVHQSIEVDVLDRLPTPWGLIRGGVAPDHPDKKKMARVYDAIAHRPGFRFIGNVCVGETVSPAQLSAWYDAVIYAIGADGERKLGIPGEDLPGCSSARRFVGWYNGHPDFSQEHFNLQTERAVIIGNGNVSMDVARILLKPVEALRQTDIAEHALEALSQSRIREVVILGRRGPAEAAFNFPELEELGDLPDTAISVEGAEALQTVLNASADGDPKMAALRKLCEERTVGQRRILLRFHTSPAEIVGDEKVEGLRLTSSNEVLSSGLILSAIGYRGRALQGLPFDEARGIFPNESGRVMDNGTPVPGAYVTGWIRRGPQGIIGSNKKCARDCVASLLADASAGAFSGSNSLNAQQRLEKFDALTRRIVHFCDWQKIDHAEREQGRPMSRPRIKFTRVEEMVQALDRA